MKKNQYDDLCIGFNPDGSPVTVKALAPVIVSASRSTDIPAFYAEWLVNRLEAGYCVWYNPFNRKPSYVSFANTRAFVFWSKNPAPLLPHLGTFDKKGLGYYFQFTVNDYVREKFEPNVGSLEKRIETFKTLSERIGRDRVIWRFDPIIMGPGLEPKIILERIQRIGNQLKGYTSKLVFSFIDVAAYRKVQANMAKTVFFTKNNVLSAEATDDQIKEICKGLSSLRDQWAKEGWKLTLATCAEGVSLEDYGIEHNRCIDDVLLRQLFPNDNALMEYLGIKQYSLFSNSSNNPQLKDKGQRAECRCISSKDIGMYDTCIHFCTYCYANTSADAVRKNRAKYSPNNESIV